MADETKIIRIEIDTGPIEKAAISIQSLTEANKKLRQERKELDITTEEGRQSIERINQSLDRNDKLIKENSSSLEKQRLNVGNYTKSIKEAIPGLDALTGGAASAATGIYSMVKASLAFIATPVGAILAAIGIALASLTAYFKGSEEGQDKLNKIMQIGGAIMEKFQDVLEAVGKALVSAFENPKQAMEDLYEFVKQNLINRFTAFGVILEGIMNLDFKEVANGIIQVSTGIEDSIGKMQKFGTEVVNQSQDAIDRGAKIAALQREIRLEENRLALESAQVQVQVSKLKEKAISEEGDQKRKTIQEAIDLEKNLSNQTVALAQKRVNLQQALIDSGKDDIENKKLLNDAEVALANAQGERYQATLRFEKQLDTLNDQDRAAAQKKYDDEVAYSAKYLTDLKDQAQKEKEHKQNLFDIDQQYNQAKIQLLDQEMDGIDLRTKEDLATYKQILADKFNAQVANENQATAYLLSNTALTEQERETIKTKSTIALTKIDNDFTQAQIDGAKKVADYQLSLDKTTVQQLGVIRTGLANLSGNLLKKGTIAAKLASHAQISIDAFKGSMAAYAQAQEAFVPPLSWIIGGISAGLVTAMGIAAHANVEGVHFAGGGYVQGPGTTTSDSIPAMLSDKEYVVRASAVRAVGVPYLDQINSRGYADGGLVTNQSTADINGNMAIAHALRMIPAPVLGLKEFHEFDDRRALKLADTTA